MSERRLTRAAAKAAAASISNPSVAASDPASNPTADATKVTIKASATKKKASKGKGKASAKKAPVAKKKTTKKVTKKVTTKKTRTTKTKVLLQEVVSGQLPHNLGSIPAKTETSPAGSDKENQPLDDAGVPPLATSVSDAQISLDAAATTLADQDLDAEEPKKEKKKRNQYGLTPGQTPFPDWPEPTAEACELVNELLSNVHGEVTPPKTIPPPSLTVTGCGEVPSVLDALIRTLLSGATTGGNSALAFDGLVQRFGILDEGIGKGSVNWDAVRQASQQDVFEAIKRGGLADIKSKHLKGILDQVHAENKARRDQLLSISSTNPPAEAETDDASSSVPASVPTEKTDKDQYEIACADQNFLSLNHLHSLPTEQVMVELTKYPGIGPKTAACVILFCLQRPCFAVDTHIFRICKWLGWLPPKVNEVTAFSHLEVRIPNHLKYSLHQLFIAHGKSCPRCRASTSENCEGWDAGCVIDHLVARSGKRKGDPPTPLKKSAKGSKKVTEKVTKKATKKSTKVTKKKAPVNKGKKAKVAAAKTTKTKVTATKRKAEADPESSAAGAVLAKKPKTDDPEEVPEEGPAEEKKEDSDETFSGFSDSEDEWEEE